MSINNATPLNGSGLPECTLDDLVSYAPSRACIYLPCKTMWPNASVDDRLPPQPLLDAYGNPVKNSKGKVNDDPGQRVAGQASQRRGADLGPRQARVHSRLRGRRWWLYHQSRRHYAQLLPPAAEART